MLSKLDAYHILFEMKSKGIEGADDNLKTISKSAEVPVGVIQYINNNRGLHITEFYEELRRKNNVKASKLYKNLMREEKDPQEALKTASSYVTQVLIKSEQLQIEEKEAFYNDSRVKILSKCISDYFNSSDIKGLVESLQVIRRDIKVLENKITE